jgi:hypothetical protein
MVVLSKFVRKDIFQRGPLGDWEGHMGKMNKGVVKMKKWLVFLFPAVFVMTMGLVVGHADNISVPDNYWGGRVVGAGPTDYGDMIAGALGEFQITAAEISLEANQLTVKLLGPYFNAYVNNIGLAGQYGPGNLYLASHGWTPTDIAPYATDPFTQAGGWDYVVTPDGVFPLNFANIIFTLASEDNIYRADQAWRGGIGGPKVADVTAYLVTQDFMLVSFEFPFGADPDLLGLHFTMACGNDVFRNEPVPLLPTVLLFGSGLLGLAGIGGIGFRRKTARG